VKYKTRWLSDGSIISGNPVLTNILWNEIGRGADLQELDDWAQTNASTIEQLTSSVFAAQAPKWTDFFPVTSIDESLARQGEVIFIRSCQHCHGAYEKGWSQPYASSLSKNDRISTLRVFYHEKTPVKNVGTDPWRAIGMQTLAPMLNDLQISKQWGITAQAQEGYVPPPLVGIWSRYPYFHNNSIPNLCVLLTPSAQRPQSYWIGKTETLQTDFDAECVGYPIGSKTPTHWQTKERWFDNNVKGLGNMGHDRMLLRQDGTELLSPHDKRALLEFLKTL
jgi:mono/diheme cytochrome c family protein